MSQTKYQHTVKSNYPYLVTKIITNYAHYMTGVYPHSGRGKVQGRMCKLEPGLPHNNQP